MRKIVSISLLFLASYMSANKIADAYKALSIFDYFKARQLFYQIGKKKTTESSFGLAIIFFRTDNPFSNIDSAAKYIAICNKTFKDTVTYSSFSINPASIAFLKTEISEKGYETYGKGNSVKNKNHFLTHFYFAPDELIKQVYHTRDELLLASFLSHQSSDTIAQFLLSYPESDLYNKAQRAYYDFQYFENTNTNNPELYKHFIKKYRANPNVLAAEIKLFDYIKPLHNPDTLYSFIKNYSTVKTKEYAWKILYSLSVKKYGKEELAAFLDKYPDYPYSDDIAKEMTLSEQILIPLKNTDEKIGFIDTLGNWVIKPVFDDAMNFSEGFASVCRNETCYYINKEGKNISNNYFEEAENFKKGAAIIKKNNLFYLINRSAQIISKSYQEINELSEGLYVCKQNNVYGAINLKDETIIPFTYLKLGDFKNGYAYYLSSKYGLVNQENKTLGANWDWVSDVDTNSLAIIKKGDKFGLMTVSEQLLLPASYDYITHCKNGIYLLVSNSLYGFYNAKETCFITNVEYQYNSAFNTDYYTNGLFFKALKNNEVALLDANGRYSINFGTYSNLFFAKCDVIRIQKNNKYGFVDRKLKPVTPVEFEKASDFEDDVALVQKNNVYQLIDKKGKPIFAQKDMELVGLGNALYLLKQNDNMGLLNASGKIILNAEYETIDLVYPNLYRCQKNKEVFLFNSKLNTLKKIDVIRN